MKKAFTLIVLFVCTSIFGQSLTLGQAINMAAKQRMLSQRMAKNKIFLTMNKLTDESEKELNSSIVLFDQNLKLLKDFAPTKEIKYKLEVQEMMWTEYKKNLLDQDRLSAKSVFDKNTSMLMSCENAISEFLTYSEKMPKLEESKLYDTGLLATTISNSGKLRYLTQRLTLYYASMYYGIEKGSVEDVKDTIELFDKTLSNLNSSIINNSDTESTIAEVYRVWSNLKPNFYKENKVSINKDNAMDAAEVYKRTNEIMGYADKLTNMYSMINLKK